MREYRRETTDERFGANVRILRERAGLSQSALAAGMTERGHPWHQQTVGRVEAGRQSLRAGELEALADILRTSIDRFTWGSAEASETEFVYRAGARLNQRYEAVAEGVIAERVTEQHKGSEHERVREACEDVARRAEEYSLQAAIDAGIWRYQERLEEQDRMDKEAADGAQSES